MLGIRPENFMLMLNENYQSEADNEIEVEINLIEPLGNQMLIYFTFEDHLLIAEHRGFISIDTRTKQKFTLNLDKINFFDTTTEERIL